MCMLSFQLGRVHKAFERFQWLDVQEALVRNIMSCKEKGMDDGTVLAEGGSFDNMCVSLRFSA